MKYCERKKNSCDLFLRLDLVWNLISPIPPWECETLGWPFVERPRPPLLPNIFAKPSATRCRQYQHLFAILPPVPVARLPSLVQ